jgi:hypothetical protein
MANRGLESSTKGGEGDAPIFDFSSVHSLLGEERKNNAERYEKQQAKRANQAAALNSLDDKLKITGHSNHQNALQGKLDGLKTWAMEQYASGGETVFADNFEKRREWENKINDFTKYNSYSTNIKEALQKEIDTAKKKDYDIEPGEMEYFNKYTGMSLEEQMQNRLPNFTERRLSAEELYDKAGYDKLNIMSKYSRDTKPDKKGVYHTKSGTVVSNGKIAGNVATIMGNTDTPFFRNIAEQSVKEVKGSGLVQEKIIENGEWVTNPDFQDVVNQHIEQNIIDIMETRNAKQTDSGSTRHQVPGHTKDIEELFIPLDKGDSGVKVSKRAKIIKDKKVKIGEEDVNLASDVWTDDAGNYFIETNVDMWKNKDGLLTTDKDQAGEGVDVIPRGSILDRNKEVVEGDDLKNIEQYREVESYDTGTGYSVVLDEKADLSAVDLYVDAEGYEVKADASQGLKDATVSEFRSDVKYKKDGDKYIFEGDDDFDNAEGEVFTEDIVTVTTPKDRNSFKRIPYTKEIANKMPELAAKVEEAKNEGKVNEAKKKTTSKKGGASRFNKK